MTPTTSTPESKLTFGQSLLVILGYIVFFSVIFTACSSIFGEKVPAAAKERYDTCMAMQMKLDNLNVIDADDKCDYLKRS